MSEVVVLKEQLFAQGGQLSALRAQCEEVKSERDVL